MLKSSSVSEISTIDLKKKKTKNQTNRKNGNIYLRLTFSFCSNELATTPGSHNQVLQKLYIKATDDKMNVMIMPLLIKGMNIKYHVKYIQNFVAK